MNDTIQVVYDSAGDILIVLGDHGIHVSREEAEQLFIDLGFVLQDMDLMEKGSQQEES